MASLLMLVLYRAFELAILGELLYMATPVVMVLGFVDDLYFMPLLPADVDV
jgi:hypothetical protein